MNNRTLLASTFAALAAFCSATPGFAQSILKTAGNYTILASQGITVAGTGLTVKDGNVGLFPAATSNITGFPPGTVSGTTLLGTGGSIINTGGANQQAEADLQVAATGLAAMPLNANFSNVDLANLGPLPPGVYKWNAAATLTGALVLDAQGHNGVSWVFQFGTTLTTAVNSTVTVINAGSNGGSDDGIFWNAATGAIVSGNNNTVLGNYIAYTSVSFTGSALLSGNGGARFLALNAAVTFAGPGTINALGGPGGGDWTGGLTLYGANVVPIASLPPVNPPYARIVNFSARAIAGAGSKMLTVGFYVAGNGKNLLVRGVGPTLADFGIANPLRDPVLTLTGPSGEIGTNSAWQTTSTGATQGSLVSSAEAQVGAFALPNGSADTALLATVGQGSFTASIASPNGSSGIVLTEIYDTDVAPDPAAHLVNVSVRAAVSPGQGALIAGMVIEGNMPITVLVRGIGPTLSDFGIAGALADPVVTVFSSDGAELATDAGWGAGPSTALQLSTAASQAGAFALPSGSRDSALLVTLQPGSYTFAVTSASNSSGVALIEVYDTQ